MNFSPKISVILPMYNQEKYIKQCLLSVINQTLKDIEIIVVDDGSTDNSLKIVEQMARDDSRITIIKKGNTGYGNSMNIAMDRSSGDYIGIVETDDYIDKKMYKHLYSLSEGGMVDIVKCNFSNCYKVGRHKDKERCCPSFGHTLDKPSIKKFTILQRPEMLRGHPSIWSAIYKREFLIKNKIRFKEEKGAAWVDNPFFFQTMCLAKSIVYTAKSHYIYRKNIATSSSCNLDFNIPINRMQENLDIVEKYNDIYERAKFYIYERAINYVYLLDNNENCDVKNMRNKAKALFSRLDYDFIINNFSGEMLNTFNKYFPSSYSLTADISHKISKKSFSNFFDRLFPETSLMRKILFSIFPANSFGRRCLLLIFAKKRLCKLFD